MSLTIRYGYENDNLDITKLALRQCLDGNILFIPGANRKELFGDFTSTTASVGKEVVIDYNGQVIASRQDIAVDIGEYLSMDRKEAPSEISISYGADTRFTDVTMKALDKFTKDGILTIPSGDHNRAGIFGDPLSGVLKSIKVIHNGVTRMHPDTDTIKIEVSNVIPNVSPEEKKLQEIHRGLKFMYGSLDEEYPEQLMSVRFIGSKNKVLELGSNVGRSTLVIASLLDDQRNLVTLECNPESYDKLLINKSINGYTFHAENAALSERPIHFSGWESIPSDSPVQGYQEAKTITFSELEKKYDNISFDTLVADCEGALYYILLDNPDMLNNIKLLIIENDYHDINHKNTVDDILAAKGLTCIYSESGGWGKCQPFFFQAFARLS